MDLASLIKTRLLGKSNDQALEYQGQWHDWAALGKTAEEIDTALTNAGLKAGARVALVARNRPSLVAAMLCLMASRRRIVMIYAYQAPTALAEDLRKSGAQAVIADAEDWSVEVRGEIRDADLLGLSLAGGSGSPVQTVNATTSAVMTDSIDEVAIEMLTSGTTGAPKRIPIRWSTINAAAEDLIGTDPDRSAGVCAPPDVLPFPIGNISGLYYLIPAVGMGRRLVLLERFKLEHWLDAVRKHGSTYAAVPPAAISMLMDTGLQAGELGKLAAIGVGAAPLDPQLQARFEERFGVPVLIGYGATEFCGVVTTWTPDEHKQFIASKRGSVGRARPGISLRIIDRDSGQVCPIDAIGVIEARVPRIGPEFIRTTDLGRIDADGFLFLHGRADEVINRGGFKVEPAKITAVLCQHPAVADAGVVGMADERLGQVPAAAVELRANQPQPTEAELLDFLREKLRSTEIPAEIRIVKALPRTPSMKVRLADLRTLFAQPKPE
ncbi:MAG: fatty acid--CoA ligase family protein [Pseudoxanthomonas sp.]